MTKIPSDINSLLSRNSKDFDKIDQEYQNSLDKKVIDDQLKIDIKIYLENARSILDYTAREIGMSIGIPEDRDIYFPIVDKTGNSNNFEGSIGRNLPGLKNNNLHLYNYLENIQPYNSSFDWLGDFVTITNNYKHVKLVPQTRRIESERIVSKSPSGSVVSWDPNIVKYGAGARVYINNDLVNPDTQLPESSGTNSITREIWIDFRFQDEISVLHLLRTLNDNIPTIVSDVFRLLKEMGY